MKKLQDAIKAVKANEAMVLFPDVDERQPYKVQVNEVGFKVFHAQFGAHFALTATEQDWLKFFDDMRGVFSHSK